MFLMILILYLTSIFTWRLSYFIARLLQLASCTEPTLMDLGLVATIKTEDMDGPNHQFIRGASASDGAANARADGTRTAGRGSWFPIFDGTGDRRCESAVGGRMRGEKWFDDGAGATGERGSTGGEGRVTDYDGMNASAVSSWRRVCAVHITGAEAGSG